VRLARAHGLGNDYLVLEDGGPLDAALVRALCDRHTGVGSDGVLEPIAHGPADHGVRIWNPDGSIAEKSGNGLRIFAQWLHRGGAPTEFSVWTGSEVVHCEIGAKTVTIDMGTARFQTPSVATIALGSTLHDVVPVDLGNPHCVRFVDVDPDEVPWREWGEALETHPAFPKRTNVQIARVRGPDVIDLRIWERGAGPTRASGSSACAAAAAAVETGRLLAGQIRVRMPGGLLWVTVDVKRSVTLEGPVEFIGVVTVDPEWLRIRR